MDKVGGERYEIGRLPALGLHELPADDALHRLGLPTPSPYRSRPSVVITSSNIHGTASPRGATRTERFKSEPTSSVCASIMPIGCHRLFLLSPQTASSGRSPCLPARSVIRSRSCLRRPRHEDGREQCAKIGRAPCPMNHHRCGETKVRGDHTYDTRPRSLPHLVRQLVVIAFTSASPSGQRRDVDIGEYVCPRHVPHGWLLLLGRSFYSSPHPPRTMNPPRARDSHQTGGSDPSCLHATLVIRMRGRIGLCKGRTCAHHV